MKNKRHSIYKSSQKIKCRCCGKTVSAKNFNFIKNECFTCANDSHAMEEWIKISFKYGRF